MIFDHSKQPLICTPRLTPNIPITYTLQFSLPQPFPTSKKHTHTHPSTKIPPHLPPLYLTQRPFRKHSRIARSNKSTRAGAERKNLDILSLYLEKELTRFNSLETQHVSVESESAKRREQKMIFEQMHILFEDFYSDFRLEVNRKFDFSNEVSLLESTKDSFLLPHQGFN